MPNAERVTITSITENYVDMLLADGPNVTRAGLRHHFDPQRIAPIGENGYRPPRPTSNGATTRTASCSTRNDGEGALAQRIGASASISAASTTS